MPSGNREPENIKKGFRRLEKAVREWKSFYGEFKGRLEYVLELPADGGDNVRLGAENREREFFNYLVLLGDDIDGKTENIFEEKMLFEQGLVSERDMSRWTRNLVNEINTYVNEYWRISTGIGTAIEESKQGRYFMGF